MERGLWAGPQGERDCLHKEARARSGAHAHVQVFGVKIGFSCAIVFMFTVLLFANHMTIVQKISAAGF
jgi:hypothetical protein